jgi:ElaB/YqjD/DUF883 family membrane-anchored ribosome-binding protein
LHPTAAIIFPRKFDLPHDGPILPCQLVKQATTDAPNKEKNMETRLQDPVMASERDKTERLLNEVKAMLKRAEEKTVERAKQADQVIRAHPYQSLGVAFGVALGLGVLIGILVRRNRE